MLVCQKHFVSQTGHLLVGIVVLAAAARLTGSESYIDLVIVFNLFSGKNIFKYLPCLFQKIFLDRFSRTKSGIVISFELHSVKARDQNILRNSQSGFGKFSARFHGH